jgi:Zn-dependent protease with chaperone function
MEANPMNLRSIILAVIILGAASQARAEANADLNWAAGYKGKTFTLRPSVNANPFTYLLITKDFATLEMRGRFFPLMGPERVTVGSVKLDAKDGVVVFEVKNDRGEDGRLRFIAPKNSAETMGQQHIDGLLALVSEGSGVAPHVVNEKSNMLHFRGSNHCRGLVVSREYDDLGTARADGLVLCPACYAAIHLLPEYEKELAMGRLVAGEVRSSYPAVISDSLQIRVQRVGRQVLDRWPVPLRGYEYRFTLVEAPKPGAMACPGGWIFLNQGLLDLCESDLELESVLAHEIAHVEMRHGLRQMHTAEQAARIGAIAGAIAVGVAASNDSKAAVAIGSIALAVSNTAIELALAGYSRDMEMEADAVAVNYLVHSQGQAERKHLARVLAKLEYLDECDAGQRSVADAFSSHPADDARSDFAANAEVVFFESPLDFEIGTKDGGEIDVHVFGLSHHAYFLQDKFDTYEDQTAYEFGLGESSSGGFGDDGFRSETRLFVAVTANNRVRRGLEFKDMEVLIDGRWIKFDNKEDTELYPDTTISMTMSHRQSGVVGIESLIPGSVRYSGTAAKKRDEPGTGL